MEYNCVAAGIDLIGSTVKSLSITNNIVNLDKEAKRSLGLNIQEPHIECSEGRFYAQLIIELEVTVEQSESAGFKMYLSLEGAFASDQEDEKSFRQLVAVNGAAALISIARGKVEAMTANVFNEGKIVLPFVNVIDYYKTAAE